MTQTQDAETGLLGIVLNDNALIHAVPQLQARHFADAARGRMWDAMRAEIDAGRVASYRTLTAGGIDGDVLFAFANGAPFDTELDSLARVVINGWQGRELARASMEAARITDTAAAMALLRREIDRIDGDLATRTTAVTAPDGARALADTLARRAETGEGAGLLCGFSFIDDRLGGVQRGSVIVIGARASMGKSLVANNVALGVAIHNPASKVIVYNMEMHPDEVVGRLCSSRALLNGRSVPYREFMKPSLEHARLVAETGAGLPHNLTIDGGSSLSLDRIRADAWRAKNTGDVGMIVVDYVGLLDTGPVAHGKTYAQHLAGVTAAFKRLATQLNCCIVLVAQLNRQPDHRENTRPSMSDIRDSGGFEQDASAVFLPYREHYYLKQNKPSDATKLATWRDDCREVRYSLTMICAKNRNGETGDDDMWVSLRHDLMADEAPAGWRPDPEPEV